MQSKCKAMQSNFIRLVFVLILYNYLIINKAVVSFRYAVFILSLKTKDKLSKYSFIKSLLSTRLKLFFILLKMSSSRHPNLYSFTPS